MIHLPALVTDLALILISAGIITLLFKWLKQPLVLGYIVAGILAGPYIDLFPTVIDTTSINTWAEIGVVFLLFALGLEFSFKKLMNVGGTAVIAATTEVISMLIIGYIVGILMGWDSMNSIFLGGMLSMSSTTIIIKAFSDLGLKSQKFTGIVFGTLVVEDLVAILMMVLLSTMAVSKHFAGEELISSLIKVAFFLILWFLIGIYLIPAFFRKVRKMMNDETLLIIVLGLCLGMVYLATETGFSAALGAFIMGSILAETVEAEHIEHIIKPVKDLFGAIFFVSVGMLVNPAILVEYIWPVAIITIVTIVGKAIFSTAGVLLSGQPLKTSIQSGFSLAQIGEFAFIIASLGVSLKVLDDYVYPIIVAVSVITTFTTPYFMRMSAPFASWFNRILPDKTLAFFERYSSGTKTINHESDWKKLVKSFSGKLVIYIVLLSAILLFSIHFLSPFIEERINQVWWGKIASTILTILLMAPFLSALLSNKNNQPKLFMRLWKDNKYNRGRLIFLVLLRVYVALTFVSLTLINIFKLQYGISLLTGIAVLAFIFFFRRSFNQYTKMESHFMMNLNQREEVNKGKASSIKTSFTSQMNNKNIHISDLEVSPNSPYVGKTLKELRFRNDFGVSIVKILRGGQKIYIPESTETLYPQDIISVVGTDEQIERFIKTIESHKNNNQEVEKEITLQSFTIDESFPFIGQSLGDSQIGEKYNCMIIGIERESGSFMNPRPTIIFEPNDLVWVVGEKERLENICN
ncbi:MAG: cation:proton antiporter [Massilibacteroides sp.]|nr:cation:proton antiporter [Massilibacteroides sp.]MDD3063109.1 cation:proton antiporter [Massilibacteroides sp.]MDD4114601.1 cation:proton antiporter [Massilibacteroides sp.]MDD4660501.1 cation:proton antiporter [Massilibacteroides sp.]